MKTQFGFIAIIFSICSCGGDTESSQTDPNTQEQIEEDSTSTALDWPYSEEGYVDSLVPFTHFEYLASNYQEPQLRENFQFLHFKDELNIYDSTDLQSSIGLLKLGDRVEIIEERWKNNIDKEGFLGATVKIRTSEGTEGYILNTYLSPLPTPADNYKHPTLLNYCLENLQLTDSVQHEGAYYGEFSCGFESEWSATVHTFENGIQLRYDHYYESGENVLFIPEMNAQQGLFLIDGLAPSDNLLYYTDGFPDEDYISFEVEEVGHSYVETEFELDGKFKVIKSIHFKIGDGCGEWFDVRAKDGGIEVEIGSGC